MFRAYLVSLVLALLLIFPVERANAGAGVWTGNGPFGGVSAQILVHPSNNNVVYALGQSGMFRSDNAGLSWKRIEAGLPAGVRWTGFFTLAPNNGDVLALNIRRSSPDPINQVFVSSNRGDRWARTRFTLPSGATSVRDIAVTVQSTGVVGVAILSSTTGNASLAISRNGGSTFSFPTAFSGYPGTATVSKVAWLANDMALISSAPAPVQFYRSSNNGLNFSPSFTAPSTASAVFSLQFAPISASPAGKLYASLRASGGTLGFFSNDFGANWLTSNLVAVNWISPVSSTSILQLQTDNPTDGFVSVVDRSSNSGVTFTSVLGPTNTQPQMSDISGDNGYPGSNVLYSASQASGLFKSTNNGVSFTPINAGFNSVGVYAIASASPTSTTLYAAQSDSSAQSHGVFKSTNAGSSWSELNLSSVRAGLIRAIAVDFTTPLTGQTLYAVGFSESRLMTGNQGVYKSVNGGSSWSILDSGLPAMVGSVSPMGIVSDVKLDPRSCAAPPIIGACATGNTLETVYLVNTGNGGGVTAGNALIVYKSTDAGARFALANVGLPQSPAASNARLQGKVLTTHVFATQTLYLATNLSGSGTGTPTVHLNGVFKSSNRGTNWTHSSNGLPTFTSGPFAGSTVNVYALVMANSNTIYAATGTGIIDGSPLNGVYKSTDAGANWTNVSNGLLGASITSLAVDSSLPDTLVAAGTGTYSNPGGVFRTTNGGGIWRSISTGLPADAVFALQDGPGAVIRAGTNAGVYEFEQLPDTDNDGSLDTVENAGPNAGDSNSDGILDSTQRFVTGFLIRTQGLSADAPARATENALGRSNHTSTTGENVLLRGGASCDQFVDVYGIDSRIYPEDIGPLGENYDTSDRGIISFELPGCARTDVVVRFHDGFFTNPADWTWRNYGPTTPGNDSTLDWYTFAGAQRLDSERWRLTINAGQLGSYRSGTSGILFRGGPAYFRDALLKNGFE